MTKNEFIHHLTLRIISNSDKPGTNAAIPNLGKDAAMQAVNYATEITSQYGEEFFDHPGLSPSKVISG